MNRYDLEKLTKNHRTQLKQSADQTSAAYNSLKTQLYAVLCSNKKLDSNTVKNLCTQVLEHNHQGRLEFISTNFGPLYTAKAEPILTQMNILEENEYKA